MKYCLGFVLIAFLTITNAKAQDNNKIVDYSASYTEFAKSIGNGAQRLIDNVEFIHNGVKMYCDSAYMYSKTNTFDAFEDVFINQGDTIHVYGDFLHYDGNSKMATIKGNVRLINKETTLTTDELEYDLGSSIGYYTDHGHIVNETNTLVSIIGYYYAHEKTFYFRDSVVINTPDYNIYSDTVKYNTETDIAYFYGPTDIVGDSSHIYCELGWYDTKNDISEVQKNAWAKDSVKTVKGEYIYYNKSTGNGIAKTNVEIIDHEKNIILLGNFAKYNDLTDYAFMTDSAQFIQFSKGDSLYLHGDSLITFPDSMGEKMLFAYNHVKFYRENVQGKCDSLVYTFSDSIARLFYDPVLWNEENQISAEQIDMYTKNKQIDKMELYQSSFMASKKSPDMFNQIKGKNMTINFIDNELNEIRVKGNGQTIYYAEDGPDIVGVNKIDCTNMTLFFVDGELNDIMFYKDNTGVLYPLEQAPENELILKGFLWRDKDRPKNKLDIFN